MTLELNNPVGFSEFTCVSSQKLVLKPFYLNKHITPHIKFHLQVDMPTDFANLEKPASLASLRNAFKRAT